jgi:hypothetical protein
MALTGYVVDPDGVRGALSRVRGRRGELTGLRDGAESAMTGLVQAAGMRSVSTALSSVWNDLIALHAEAAETRIDQGTSGMEAAVQAFEDGSRQMMDDAHESMGRVPDVVIDDAMVVEEGV